MLEFWANNLDVRLHHYLVLAAVLFSIGIYGVLSRKSAIGILISIELMLNATALNFLAFNRYVAPNIVDGAIMAIFIIAVAAAEAVVAMAIFVALYKHRRTIDVTQMDLMKG